MLWALGSRAFRGSQLLLEDPEGFLEDVRFELMPKGLVGADKKGRLIIKNMSSMNLTDKF